jgi:uncharacterized phage protein gp47/JayE
MSDTLTIASPPSTSDAATSLLAIMGGQSGVITDYNQGSQIRTLSEAAGSVVEMQGILVQAALFQAIVYSGFAAFGIIPLGAIQSTGSVTFATGTGMAPPPASQTITIPSGTLVQTTAGVQFSTTAQVVVASGTTSINAPVQAVLSGSNGNVSASTINQIISGLTYPLYVYNTLPTAGGSNAESPAQTMARFNATVLAIGRASPISIANACIGVSYGAESVEYATVYEPWITNPTVIGFTVYIDNGSGAASSNLITAVTAVLDGNLATGDEGQRPAGVPFSVAAVTPVVAKVIVTATLLNSSMAATLAAAVISSVDAYFATLNFADTAEQVQIAAAVANALAGYITSLAVVLENSSSTSVLTIAANYSERVILQSITNNLS